MDDFVSDKSIGQLDGRDMERMKALTAKVAKKLAAKHARRRKRKNRGQLDVRKTLRMNAGLDATPFHLEWKQKKEGQAQNRCNLRCVWISRAICALLTNAALCAERCGARH